GNKGKGGVGTPTEETILSGEGPVTRWLHLPGTAEADQDNLNFYDGSLLSLALPPDVMLAAGGGGQRAGGSNEGSVVSPASSTDAAPAAVALVDMLQGSDRGLDHGDGNKTSSKAGEPNTPSKVGRNMTKGVPTTASTTSSMSCSVPLQEGTVGAKKRPAAGAVSPCPRSPSTLPLPPPMLNQRPSKRAKKVRRIAPTFVAPFDSHGAGAMDTTPPAVASGGFETSVAAAA
ncbi:unnamed protein product, partial [Choristocarpus tenellus]